MIFPARINALDDLQADPQLRSSNRLQRQKDDEFGSYHCVHHFV